MNPISPFQLVALALAFDARDVPDAAREQVAEFIAGVSAFGRGVASGLLARDRRPARPHVAREIV